jgi:malate dehydrogenase (oxaloacetate-decarboxylating)(NADP+)
MSIRKQESLDYHEFPVPGKCEVIPTKPCRTQRDLSLAYTPGVAEPCLEIEKDAETAFRYTNKGNLVAVVTNGTAVLGLGDIGSLAGKPVMEGKGVLFKRFADVDVFDIEVDTHDPDEIIKVCQLLEPTFGGINLEDIKAPECFYIEETLKETLDIPVFHDDQHGTAIISGAGLINALEVVGKDIGDVRVVFNGAGAAGIACATHYVTLGVKIGNIMLCDSKGVIYKGREDMDPKHPKHNKYKARYAADTDARSLDDAMKGTDVFCGVSVKDCVSQDMVRSMADNPIIFAMANPDPEITYPDAMAARDDLIMGTGRSDYPNQVNNVLGFPFIFRGALDVRAKAITDGMKVAATYALANLAKEDVPEVVKKAYGGEQLRFGPKYVIPKPFDPRVLLWEASAVAEAAMAEGVASVAVDIEKYREKLEARLGKSREVTRLFINKAKDNPKRIVYPEGENETILHACQIVLDEGIAEPILLGRKDVIEEKIKSMNLELEGATIVDPSIHDKRDNYVSALYEKRRRKGVTETDAKRLLQDNTYFGAMMVCEGEADGLIAGITQHYPETIRPALQVISTEEGVKRVAGVYALIFKNKSYFLADCTVNFDPSAEDIAETAIHAANVARSFGEEPVVAMLSFSNFGSTRHPESAKMADAVRILRERDPNLQVDGEMQADTAVSAEVAASYPFSTVAGNANVLVFSNLTAANVAYKLLQRIGGAEAIGPILVGTKKPVHVVQIGSDDESSVVTMTAIAVVDAQYHEEKA